MTTDLIKLFRKRWPEMLLVTAFRAFGIYLIELIAGSVKPVENGMSPEIASDLPERTIFMYAIGGIAFLVFWLTLYLGFLATVSTDSFKSQEPVTLLKTGRGFFWRVVRFEILLGLYTMFIYMISLSIIRLLLLKGIEMGREPQWVHLTCQAVALVVLVKLRLVPAIMIIYDQMVLPSLRTLRQFEILKAKPLLVFIGVAAALNVSIPLLVGRIDKDTVVFDLFTAGESLLSGILTLLIGLAAIWFVGGGKFGSCQQRVETEENRL